MLKTTNSKVVTDLYDDVWNAFDQPMVEEAFQLLLTRILRNNLPIDIFKDKVVLDMGCGSGRYSIAIKRLGAQKVVGIDLGEGKKISFPGVEYLQASALELPFPDNSFDFVFCNGVLHHTTNPLQGIREMYRVMKLGGQGWLFLCGVCKFYEMLDHVRRHLDPADSKTFRKLLELWLLPVPKQFFLTDLLFVGIRHYFTREELESALTQIGFKELQFLARGVDYDFTEQVYRQPELAEYFNKNGEGDLRFLMKK